MSGSFAEKVCCLCHQKKDFITASYEPKDADCLKKREYKMTERKMIIETDRLLLRRFCEEDLQDLYEYLSDEAVVWFEPYKPMDMNEVKDNLDWRISTEEMIAVELKSSHKMIGNVYLGKRDFDALELGYVFNRHYWGHGYAVESCDALIRKAFSEGVHRIYAECDPCNTASWKLLERLNFAREAHFRQNVFFRKDKDNNPIWKDTYVYSILNKQAFQKPDFDG